MSKTYYRKNYKKFNSYKTDNRQKKINSQINNAIQDFKLTGDAAYDVLSFAKNYFDACNGALGNVFTPYTTNQRLGEIGLKTQNLQTSDLKKAFNNPTDRNSQKLLSAYSEYLRLTDSVAKRTFDYVTNIITFDMSFHCKNINTPEDYDSDEYVKDYRIFKSIRNNFDYKSEFNLIVKRMVQNDAYYGIFRTDVGNYTFQEMPAQNCIITGKNSDWGFLYDFNMEWFLQQGVSIDMYPNEVKELYKNVMCGEGVDNQYDPSNKLTQRDGIWGLWTQTSPLPEEGCFTCFKWNTDIYSNVPFLTSLFKDAINKDIVRELQQNEYIIASQKLLVGLIPLLKEQKSGQIKDALAISPDTMGKFLGLLQQGLQQINVKGVPFSDVKEVTYDIPTKSIYEEATSNEAGNAGVTASFIYTSNAKTAQEIRYNAMVDSAIISSVYNQFNKWFSTYVNHFTKKFKFDIKFKGTIFDRKERLDNALKLADKGMIDFQELANGLNGDDIFAFEEKITQSSKSGIWKVMKLLPNVNTMSSGSGTSTIGRPTTDDPADSTGRNLQRIEEGGVDV